MCQIEFHASWVGHIAHRSLGSLGSARVAGTTSRGAFLRSSDLTLFLSTETFRGPLTINLADGLDQIPSLANQEEVLLSSEGLVFPLSNLRIVIPAAGVWGPGQPPAYNKPARPGPREVLGQAKSLLGDHPYLALLDPDRVGGQAFPPDFALVEEQVRGIRSQLAGENSPLDLTSVEKLIGCGPGLTPLGDDLLLGIVLAAKRAGKDSVWAGAGELARVVSAARERSTSLSSSLVACAAEGSADERIIQVLDGLIAGREIPDLDLKNLLEWGSSSGVAVLVGMALAL